MNLIVRYLQILQDTVHFARIVQLTQSLTERVPELLKVVWCEMSIFVSATDTFSQF